MRKKGGKFQSKESKGGRKQKNSETNEMEKRDKGQKSNEFDS
jgi:hypothetical protein